MLLARPLVLGLVLVLVASAASPARAQDRRPAPEGAEGATSGEAGHGFVEARIGYYHNDDGGGNPFLDETETVIEPVIVLDYNVTDRLSTSAQLSYDMVSSASIDRLSRYPEQSGASGDNYFGGELGVRYRLTDDLRLGVHGSASTEYDYKSVGGGADVSLDLFAKQTTLSLGGTYFSDTVSLIRFNGVDQGEDQRQSLAVNVGWYQVLSPDAHVDLGYTFGHQTGFLETSFNGVVLEDASDPPNPFLDNNAQGVEVAEEMPDVRTRHALHGEFRHTLGAVTAVGVAGRLYTDSWGITSYAAEPRLYRWLIPGVLRTRLRYRYYSQTAADQYSEHFFVPPGDRPRFVAEEERTQDADLGDFNSHTIGLKLTWGVTEAISLDLAGDYILRSDGLDQILVAGGIRWDF
jgi:hypothetical protein